jgi:DNA-binding Lrp family transcriptional regulator
MYKQKQKRNMPPIQLSDTDQEILEILEEGRNAPLNIANRLDFTRQYVQRRLKRLEEHGHVQNIGSGVYEITDDPRKD